jgi:DNA-binding IclR family transcriptional regulator
VKVLVELSENEKKVVEAIKMLGATSKDKLKTADHIARAAMMPKGRVANIIMSLVHKKVIKRVAREKAAGYYLIPGQA